ncbi:hypothetical protein LINGRAPRIM_LOCUS83 [Linum grandiflorum]
MSILSIIHLRAQPSRIWHPPMSSKNYPAGGVGEDTTVIGVVGVWFASF